MEITASGCFLTEPASNMSVAEVVDLTLPSLPDGWAGGEKGFKVIGTLSSATQRNLEPVGPHFLAHARRVSFVLSFVKMSCSCEHSCVIFDVIVSQAAEKGSIV